MDSIQIERSNHSNEKTSRHIPLERTFTGISISAKYLIVQFTIRLTFSSPKNLAIVCTSSNSPSLYATNPFWEKLYGKRFTTSAPSCSSCLGKSEPPTMPTVIFVESVFIKSSISGVISPRGTVRVPSTSKRAMMRGFAGAIVDGFAFLLEIGSLTVVKIEIGNNSTFTSISTSSSCFVWWWCCPKSRWCPQCVQERWIFFVLSVLHPEKILKAGGRKWNTLPIQFSSSVLVKYIICKTMSGGRGYEGGRTRMVSDICGDRTQNTLHTSSNTFSVFVFQLTTLFLSGNEGMLLVKFWDTTLPFGISVIMVFFVVLHSDPGDTECVSRACTESMEKSILIRKCFITHILLTPERIINSSYDLTTANEYLYRWGGRGNINQIPIVTFLRL